jgi:hypothetical protein
MAVVIRAVPDRKDRKGFEDAEKPTSKWRPLPLTTVELQSWVAVSTNGQSEGYEGEHPE